VKQICKNAQNLVKNSGGKTTCSLYGFQNKQKDHITTSSKKIWFEKVTTSGHGKATTCSKNQKQQKSKNKFRTLFFQGNGGKHGREHVKQNSSG